MRSRGLQRLVLPVQPKMEAGPVFSEKVTRHPEMPMSHKPKPPQVRGQASYLEKVPGMSSGAGMLRISRSTLYHRLHELG